MRRRVLVLTKTTALGGAERLVMNTLPHLDRERFDYAFAAFDDGGPLARACREAGVPFRTMGRSPRALRQTLLREGFDVVHAHLPIPGALARIAARGLATRVVYTEHTLQDVYRAPSRWLNLASYGWQDAVIAVSQRVRASAIARVGPSARVHVIPNGVDLEQVAAEALLAPAPPPPRRPGATTWLVPASLTPVKGHDVLLAALARLGGLTGPPIDVWLAGEGPERKRIALAAAGLPAAIRVHLLGWRRDVYALMAASDAIALPSRGEGHPLALLEAASLGRPVVASAVGGIPEIVTPGGTGLLVAPEDPAALAAALQRLRVDPVLRQTLGAAAREEAVLRFDVRRSLRAVEALYERVAARPRITRRAYGSRSSRSLRDPATAWRGR